jgi:hypothetical protein
MSRHQTTGAAFFIRRRGEFKIADAKFALTDFE